MNDKGAASGHARGQPHVLAERTGSGQKNPLGPTQGAEALNDP